MKSFQRTVLFLSLCSLLFLPSCIVKDSPAPGCVEYLLFAPMGGCNGKTILTDLTLEGFPECIVVTVNNCNGGVLAVQNDCSEALTLGKLEIPSGESFNLDVQPDLDGGFVLVRTPSNFSDYTPATDQTIQITGAIGDQTLNVAFLKTAPLCEYYGRGMGDGPKKILSFRTSLQSAASSIWTGDRGPKTGGRDEKNHAIARDDCEAPPKCNERGAISAVGQVSIPDNGRGTDDRGRVTKYGL